MKQLLSSLFNKRKPHVQRLLDGRYINMEYYLNMDKEQYAKSVRAILAVVVGFIVYVWIVSIF